MPDIHSIIVEIKPDQAVAGMGKVDGALAKTENTAKRVSRTIGEEYAKAAKEGAKAGVELERAQAKAAREVAAAHAKAAKATASSAREAARAQEEHARHVTMTVERHARERLAAEQAAYRKTVAAAREAAAQQEAAAQRARTTAGGGAGSSVASGLGIGAFAGPAAGVAATVALGREVLQLGDSYQNLTNRLNTLTGSEAAAIPLREKLLDLANRTRTSNSSVVELYARIAGSARELGTSEADLIEFTERLTKSFKVSGASTVAQQQAMVQLAQGMGAGKLRGEEYNSVLEAAPNIIDIIGKSLGKTRGEMRAMADAGMITTGQIIEAFKEAGDEIDDKFSRNVATSADLMVVLKNEIERTVGSLVQQADILPALAEGLGVVGEQIRDLGKEAGDAIKSIKGLYDEFGMLTGVLATEKGRKYGSALFANFSVYGKAEDMVTGWLGGPTENLVAGIKAEQEKIAAAEKQAVEDLAKRNKALWDQYAKSVEGDSAIRALRRGVAVGIGVAKTVGDEAGDALAGRKSDAPKAIKRDLSMLDDSLERTGIIADDFLSRIRGGIHGGIDELGEHIRESADAADLAQERFAALSESVSGFRAGFGAALDGFGNSMTESLQEMAESAKKAEKDVVTFKEAMGGAFGDVAVEGIDAFVEAMNGASFSFSEFARGVLIDLEKMLIKFLAFQAIKATIGVASGSFGGALAGALGYAAGGDYTVPNNGRGTDGVPVHMRLSPGERVRVTPAGQSMDGAGGGGQTVVNNRVVVVDDREAAAREYAQSTDNERTVISIIARNAGKIRAALS